MWWLWGKGESGFSSSSTAEEVTGGIEGSGLTAIVTGGASGIGAETVRVLALRGVHVTMGDKNTAAGNMVKEAIVEKDPDAKIDVVALNLSSRASVRKFASNYSSSGLRLNILINNAGIIVPQFMLSEDNIELQFSTKPCWSFSFDEPASGYHEENIYGNWKRGKNRECFVHDSHFTGCMTGEESVMMKSMTKQAPKSISFSSLLFGYDYISAYKQSKLANILHANELARRIKEDGVEITANSVHPGFVTTGLYRDLSFIHGLATKLLNTYAGKNVEQGAATACYVVLHPQVKGISGEYFSNCNLDRASSQATDVSQAKKLWDLSEKLVK